MTDHPGISRPDVVTARTPLVVIEFGLPAPLMNMNHRDHWHTRTRLVRAWRRAAAMHTLDQTEHLRNTGPWPLPPSTVTLVLPVPDRRARDPHNLYPTIKACVDGMVDAGCWPDDTPDQVRTTEPALIYRKPSAPVQIYVFPGIDPVL